MRWFGKKRRDSNDSVRAIREFGEALSRGAPLDPYLDFVQSSAIIRDVMEHHGIERDDLAEFYSRLRRAGAGQTIGGHYVPSSALANPLSLDFICTILGRDDGWDDHNKWLFISSALVDYVTTGESDSLARSFFGDDD